MKSSKEKLRVLRISHTASLSTYRARERALVERHPVDLAVVTAKDWPHLGLEPDKGSEAFELHSARTMLGGNVPLFAFDPSTILNAIKSHRPHIVDIHQEPYSVAGFEAVWLAYQFARDAPRIFCTAQNIEKKYPPPFVWTEKFVYDTCVASYMCSLEAEQVLRRKGYRGITEIFPLGIDEDFYNPALLDETTKTDLRTKHGMSSDFVVGYFGRLESYKGPQLLVEAIAQSSLKEQKIKLMIAGSGEYINELRTLSESRGVQDSVYFVGSLEASETPKYICACDAVAVPSLTRKNWKEQFGRVPVEAMACGVPVISSDSGSLPEVVAGAGIIVPENDADALASAILSLKKDEQLRQKLIQEGLAKVKADYTWDVIADRTYDLYNRILPVGSEAIAFEKKAPG